MSVVFPSVVSAGPFAQQLAQLATDRSWRRIAVVRGKSFATATAFDASAATIDANVRVWDRGPAHAPVEHVERLAHDIRHFQPDVLVAAGGGSSHDAVKGVAVLLARGGRLLDHCLEFTPPDRLVVRPLSGPKLPIVTIPTTLAGSEANGAAGFAHDGRKRVLADPTLTPTAVVIDERLAAATPSKVYLGSAMNALNHCVEGLASRRRDAWSDVLLRSALRELAAATEAIGAGENRYATAGCASVLAGAGLLGTWLGVAHAIGHVVGARYGVPHGWSHAVVAGAAIRFNADDAGAAHDAAAQALGLSATSAALADWMDRRAEAWGLPRRLRDLGVAVEHLDELAFAAWADHDTYYNPRRPSSPAEIRDLLADVY